MIDRFADREFLLFVASAITSKPYTGGLNQMLNVVMAYYDRCKVVEDWLLTYKGGIET